MKTYSYPKNAELFERASKVIPCGIYGHFSPAPLVPPDAFPAPLPGAAGSVAES